MIGDWTDPLWRKDAGEATVRAGECQGRTGWNDRIIMEMQQIILLRFCKTYCKFVSNFFKIFYLNTRNLWYKFLARITEQRKDDYDNDVSDNCDRNFGTFDDFGVKNDQKVSNNMILMSKYKGKHGGKKGQKIWAWVDPLPHHSGNARKKTFFFHWGLPLCDTFWSSFFIIACKDDFVKINAASDCSYVMLPQLKAGRGACV